jgi:glycine cleavage system H protein
VSRAVSEDETGGKSMSVMRYTEDHEWLRVDDGDIATVGITDHAQSQLGDLVTVELPALGKEVVKGAEVAVVDSVKAASEVMAPVSGSIVEVNETLASEPGIVNRDPTGEGWFFKIKMSDPAELDTLMDESTYNSLIGE